MQIIKQLVAIAAMSFPIAAFAHGGVEHLMGTAKTVDAKGMVIVTQEKKEVKVAFDETTKFEKDGAPSSIKELAAGARVVVNATKKSGVADLVAVLVKLGSKGAEHAEHAPAARTIALSVTEQGFTPNQAKVKKGEPVDLVITRKTDKTCATAIHIPDYDIKRELPLNEAVTVRLTPNKSGDVKYTCAMGMLGGVLSVE